MAQQNRLHQVNLASIARRCGQETSLFFQRKHHDPRFCFELLRRAIVDRSQDAWDLVYAQYGPLVSGWVERNSAFPSSGEEVQYFVNRAFEKMWTALPPDRFARFPDLKSLLRYLQMCVNSVILDQVRRKELAVVDLESATASSADIGGNAPGDRGALDRLYSQELWRQVTARLKDDRERIVVYGCFVLALKPREIQARYEETFRDVREVYRVKENVLARLARDTELRDILAGRKEKTIEQDA